MPLLYLDSKTTSSFLAELSRSTGIPVDLLVQKIMTGPNDFRGTWVHPQVAINLGQWASQQKNKYININKLIKLAKYLLTEVLKCLMTAIIRHE